MTLWDATSFSLELQRPAALWLLPVAIVLWLGVRRRHQVIPVGSTLVWHQVPSPVRLRRPLLILLILITAVLALSRPRVLPGLGATTAVSTDGPPPRVRDRSASPAIAQALRALEEAGTLRPVTTEATDIEIVRSGMTSSAPFRIVLPSTDEGEFALTEPGPVPDRWLLGLDARSWTIPSASAPPEMLGCEVVLDSTSGPLIGRAPDRVVLAFDPEGTSLAEAPVWPVLLGRAITSIAPTPPPPAGRTHWPTTGLWVIVAVLLVSASRILGRRGSLLALLGVAGAAWLPAVGIGEAPSVELESELVSPAVGILEAARKLPYGGTIQVPVTCRLPLEESALLRTLRARNVELRWNEPPARLTVHPRRPERGSTVRATTSSPSGTSPAATLTIQSPSGGLERRPVPPGGEVTFPVTETGPWFLELDSTPAVTAWIVVPEPLPVVLLTDPTGATPPLAGALFPDSDFDVRIVTPDTLAASLPDPERGVVVWDGLDPTLLPDPGPLRSWLQQGGTLFIAAAPPFFERGPGRDALDALLPAPLPDPPRERPRELGTILLDLSGSMREGSWRALVEGTRALVEGSPAGSEWGVAGFSAEAGWIARPGSPVSDALVTEIEQSSVSGGTRLDRGIELVLAAASSGQAGTNLVILSDGRARPADWARLGARLGAAGVKVTAVALGPRADDAALRTLVEATNGTLHLARTASAAQRLLSEVVDPPPGPWRDVEGSLRPGSLDPLARVFPGELPRPTRRLAIVPGPEARFLLVDARGNPLLLQRMQGAGRTLMYASGLDRESLGTAGSRLLSALSTVVAASPRQRAVPHREVALRTDRDGHDWLCVERLPEDPETFSWTPWPPPGDAAPRPALEGPHGVWRFTPPSPSTALIGTLPDGGWVASGPEDGSGRGVLARFCQRTHDLAPPHAPWPVDGWIVGIVLGFFLPRLFPHLRSRLPGALPDST